MGTVWIALCLLPYAGREDYIEATSVLNDVMVERMFTTTLPAGNVEIPAFLSILVAISIWAYIKKPQTKEACFYYVNWIGLAVFADFFIFVFAHPYWIVLLAPYLILLVVMNAEHTKINLILEFFLSACVSVFYWCTFGVYVTEDTFSYLVLPRFGLVPNGTGCQGLSRADRGEGLGELCICFIWYICSLPARLSLDQQTGKEAGAVQSAFGRGLEESHQQKAGV